MGTRVAYSGDFASSLLNAKPALAGGFWLSKLSSERQTLCANPEGLEDERVAAKGQVVNKVSTPEVINRSSVAGDTIVLPEES